MMPTFQAVILAIFYGFSVFLPISGDTHAWAIPFFFEWQSPSPEFQSALSFGALISLLFYFRHDWASIFSSALRVVLLWQKPKTIDERMPLFILVSVLPPLGLWHYFGGHLEVIGDPALWYAGSLVLFSFPLWIANRLNRKTKNIFNWSTLDAFILGICQTLILIPGAGRQVGALSGAFLRNFSLEAASKFMFFSFLPILFLQSLPFLKHFSWDLERPTPDLSWLSFFVVIVLSVFCGIMAIGGFMKNLNIKGIQGYLTYRVLLALGILSVYFFRGTSF